eukprot:8554987-Alexandrium_andersonii.AAC.1
MGLDTARDLLGIRSAEFLRTFAQQVPPPRMLFELREDDMQEEYKKLRANVVSSWAGPKCKITD